MFNRKQVCVTIVLTCVGNGSWCALEGFFKCPRNVSWRVLEIFLSALEMFPGVCWKSFWSESCVGLRLVAGRWLMDPQHKIVKEIWGNFEGNLEEIFREIGRKFAAKMWKFWEVAAIKVLLIAHARQMTEGTEAWRSFKPMMVMMMEVMMRIIVKMERNRSHYVPCVMGIEKLKISKKEKK